MSMIVLEKESAGLWDDKLRAVRIRETMRAGEKETGSGRHLQGLVARVPQKEVSEDVC